MIPNRANAHHPPENNKKALVIGAGFGGMAAALRARAMGYDVTIYDRMDRLGGRAQVYERDGFRHDAGPTVITAPFLLSELFELFDRDLNDFLTLVELDPWYRFVFNDGRAFDYGGTVEDTMAEIAKFNKGDQEGYRQLVAQSKKIFDIGFEQLADQPFHRGRTMLSTLPSLVKLKAYQSVFDHVGDYIKDPHLRRAFSIQSLLLGGNPFDTTSIYGLIHYLERKWGIHFVMGGTGALVDGLGQLMEEVGINIRLNTTIDRIQTKNKTATGVVSGDGRQIDADIIISNADPTHVYDQMVDQSDLSLSAKIKQKTAHYSMGLFVLYFGTTRQYPDVAHHTIWMGKRYRSLLDDIFHKRVLPDDFSLYLHRPTATDDGFAPDGCDSFYVLAPVPNLQADIDWATEGPKLRDRIVRALNDTILPGLSESITADFFKTPADFETDYLSTHGAGFSIAPLLRQSGWFRFHNKSESLDNLYLVGAGTHPGAGLPGVISSAKVVGRLLRNAQ
jgi:phytoene desaturase